MNMKTTPLALVSAALLSACTVGPEYRRPDLLIPQVWRQPIDSGAVVSGEWWAQFQDPSLTRLVQQALAGNKDVVIAAANIDEALARYGVARSALFPEVGAGASASRGRPQNAATTNEYNAVLSASFEIDLWGRLRHANDSARANSLASEEAQRTVALTLVTSIASGYIQLRALDRQLEIATSTSRSLAEAARLQRVRFEQGAVPESDYRQAESEYHNAAAQISDLERLIARQENFLSVLAGRNPGSIERGLSIDQLAFPPPPSGLPAELLERRPDIRQAEQELIAANADIGSAKAALFPRISLTGLLGVESNALSEFFKGPARTWSYGLNLGLPIFNAGRLESEVAQAEARQRKALAGYEKTVMVAFQDVENALVDRSKLAQQRDSQAANVAALRRFRDLATLRYREGAAIYLEVSRAEESLLNAQLAYVVTQAHLFQAYADLYKAMGGGWPEAEKLTRTDQHISSRR
jgi:multidrug efflux system outer membrane protein